jgi:hypothetical protein
MSKIGVNTIGNLYTIETLLFMNQCDCLSVKMYIFTFQSSSKNVRTTVQMRDDVTTTIKLKEQTTCLQIGNIRYTQIS